MRVAVLGLGVMGAGMAGNLLKHGHALAVYNRSAAKAAPLAAQGAHVASIPREAAEGAEVIIAMVGDDRASRAIWLGNDGALAGARSGAVLVECSTLSLGWVRELGSAAAQRGLAFLDSPVTGSKDAAEAGELASQCQAWPPRAKCISWRVIGASMMRTRLRWSRGCCRAREKAQLTTRRLARSTRGRSGPNNSGAFA